MRRMSLVLNTWAFACSRKMVLVARLVNCAGRKLRNDAMKRAALTGELSHTDAASSDHRRSLPYAGTARLWWLAHRSEP